MAQNILVYWHGIVGIAGKGPNYMERYDPNRTIGELIQAMTTARLNERKTIQIIKFKYGNVSAVNPSDPYWSHNTKLSEYLAVMGLENKNLFLIYTLV